MNRSTLLVALTMALSLVAAGSAFADDPTIETSRASSTLKRAQVTDQVLQARAAGTLIGGDARLNQGDVLVSTRSREDVRAETLAAIASGEVLALTAETVAFQLPSFTNRHATVTTIMANARR